MFDRLASVQQILATATAWRDENRSRSELPGRCCHSKTRFDVLGAEEFGGCALTWRWFSCQAMKGRGRGAARSTDAVVFAVGGDAIVDCRAQFVPVEVGDAEMVACGVGEVVGDCGCADPPVAQPLPERLSGEDLDVTEAFSGGGDVATPGGDRPGRRRVTRRLLAGNTGTTAGRCGGGGRVRAWPVSRAGPRPGDFRRRCRASTRRGRWPGPGYDDEGAGAAGPRTDFAILCHSRSRTSSSPLMGRSGGRGVGACP